MIDSKDQRYAGETAGKHRQVHQPLFTQQVHRTEGQVRRLFCLFLLPKALPAGCSKKLVNLAWQLPPRLFGGRLFLFALGLDRCIVNARWMSIAGASGTLTLDHGDRTGCNLLILGSSGS